MGFADLHGYHCGCWECDYTRSDAFPLRMQRDSSCSGEVISRIFDSEQPDVWRPVMAQLANAAVDTDAEPGWDAGYHVHVGNGGQSVVRRARAFYAFLQWEPAFADLASGRFPQQRDMNRSVHSDLWYSVADSYGRSSLIREARFLPDYEDEQGHDRVDWYSYFEELNQDEFQNLARYLYERQMENDRHSNLNVRTGHGGFEFRLWNSTRSAWRMELFARLSLAFTDRRFVNHLLAAGNPTGDLGHDATVIGNAVSAMEDTDTLALLMRQVHYTHHRATDAPSLLTLV